VSLLTEMALLVLNESEMVLVAVAPLLAAGAYCPAHAPPELSRSAPPLLLLFWLELSDDDAAVDPSLAELPLPPCDVEVAAVPEPLFVLLLSASAGALKPKARQMAVANNVRVMVTISR
jgi:hypothetical protein